MNEDESAPARGSQVGGHQGEVQAGGEGGLAAALRGSRRGRAFLLVIDSWARTLFGGGAMVAILILVLIMVFLVWEGAGFIPEHHRSLVLYRRTGQEFVDAIRGPLVEHQALNRYLSRVRATDVDEMRKRGVGEAEAGEWLAAFDTFAANFRAAGAPLRSFVDGAAAVALDIKGRSQGWQGSDAAREANRLRELLPGATAALGEFESALRASMASVPASAGRGSEHAWARFRDMSGRLAASIPGAVARATAWDPDRPVPMGESLSAFFLGRRWAADSEWHERYGLLPLLIGSLCISAVAILVAVPFSVAAAIYVSQFATSAERGLIKPTIELIAAIPSIVLGFFGITVLGSGIQWLSGQPWMSWVPFFPVTERLNIFTAGLMLALMASPTIFTLAEDALRGVPVQFEEGSLALGATRFQTAVRMVVPAALSGIIAAVLLGFGRIVGETMVVLLVAGNRLEIPDFTQGFGALFQPAHTMTGIIAQELGEAPGGSLHYRALFMVGLTLFVMVLMINCATEMVLRRFHRMRG
ncbi:MAG TPA: phosphate ABC transporter permease subunit PstC [Verrucomicrobiae bacterium]|nr:phosphate ABC transporter permease subunit PstC [Verrucomicrobiae bacterium]